MGTAEYIQLTGFPVLPGRPGAPTGPGDPCKSKVQLAILVETRQADSLLCSRFWECHATLRLGLHNSITNLSISQRRRLAKLQSSENKTSTI